MTSPGADIQQHLYMSFLEGKTADVALRVHGRGSWYAIYKLHKVVLIQANFFESLFTAGFQESSPRRNSTYPGLDEIDITFDDYNITRAAFEICIASLYGGGPPLCVPPSLRPTPYHPLTPNFPPQDGNADPKVPSGHHPATPRFLLSLLATAIYLSIPSVVSQALDHVIGSVGPHTVINYLDFALGKPIPDRADFEPLAAVGLEALAHPIPSEDDLRELTESGDGTKDENSGEPPRTDAKLSASCSSASSEDGQTPLDKATPMSSQWTHYGSISDKIGEAAACWLARWAPDVLAYEEKLRVSDSSISRSNSSATPVFAAWARGGLDANWVSGLVGSDALFVKGEKERYDFAKAVVELRRNDGIDEEEEQVWANMFKDAIYYSNMYTEDIIAISQDTSPTTGRRYVSLAVLQAAHWSQSVLRHHIINSPTSSPSSSPHSPHPHSKDLGLALTTADILSGHLKQPNSDYSTNVTYHPVPTDTCIQLGGKYGLHGKKVSMDQLFEVSSQGKDRPCITPSEANFFGLQSERLDTKSCIAADPTGKSRWVQHPPYRFAVEFWDVHLLREKTRLHSHTVWYAGNLFRVYIQLVRKKGLQQLGIYLHRQSSIEPIPKWSVPYPPRTRTDSRDRQIHSGALPSASVSSTSVSATATSPSPSRSTTPGSVPASPVSAAGPSGIPATAPSTGPLQPYRDPRNSVSAYFTISCAGPTGNWLTRFTSAPDVFNVSQSWGWIPSSFRILEDAESGFHEALEEGAGNLTGRPEISLRATVVLGII